jgi:antitoxin VapB
LCELSWYILSVYIKEPRVTRVAKIFINGRSQAVRLPREFRFSGTEVRVMRHGRGVLLEPISPSVDDWFAELDKFKGDKFPAKRSQPQAPVRNDFA